RPGYTLTKERSKQRLYGTLIGAAIAAVIVLISQNTYLYTVLSIISLMLAFSFLQKNYRTASIFVTTSVIFIYALINPNAFQVIQFRIIDTLTGAAISMLAISFLWPAWEIQNIKTVIATAIKASRNYLTTINDYYHQSAEDRTSYKLARKEAFLGMGNLNGAFQRMSQEPESKQKNLGKLYEIVGLNHTFLAATAALGTYLLSKKNEEVSDSFEVILAAIDSNLNQALQSLQKQELTEDIATDKLEEAYENLDEQFNQLVAIRTKQLEEDNSQPIDPDVRKKMQKEKLISDQLKWLATISGNLKKLVKELD
ncbi:MAG: putative membrane protein YccC, partial [Marivirga sp.]